MFNRYWWEYWYIGLYIYGIINIVIQCVPLDYWWDNLFLSLFWVGFLTWGYPPNHPGLNGIFHQPAIGGSECQDSAGRCCATSPPTKRSWSTELILFVAEMRRSICRSWDLTMKNRDFTSNNDVFTIRKLCFYHQKCWFYQTTLWFNYQICWCYHQTWWFNIDLTMNNSTSPTRMDGGRLCLNSGSWNDEEPLFFLVTQAEFSWPMFFLGGRSWRSLRSYRSEECHWFLQTCQEESGGQGASFGVETCCGCHSQSCNESGVMLALQLVGLEFLLSLPINEKVNEKRHETLQDKGNKDI